MKMALNKSIRDEKGQALILVVILLLVGTLIITPLLSFMGTGLIAGRVYEERMEEVYAAEAGVEDAIWQIITKAAGLPQTEDNPPMPPYSIADVNGKVVDPVIITYIDEKTYKINSTATSTDTGSSSTIESYINILYFYDFMQNAITSVADVNLQPGSGVTGDIQYNGSLTQQPGSTIDGTITTDPIEGWPTAEQLHNYYWPDVENLGEYPDAIIDLKDTTSIPLGLYSVGDLTITNTGSAGANLTLGGTVYVTGDLEFKQTGDKDYEIHLNGQTIFVLGDIDFPSNRCTVYGNGCIIAVGDINFQPSMESSADSFVFIMSVEGTVQFQPSGDFYGSIAGNVDVNLQPGSTLFWTGPPPTLKYPGSEPSEKNVIQAIRTWEIGLTQ